MLPLNSGIYPKQYAWIKPGTQKMFSAGPKQDLLPHTFTKHLPTIKALQTIQKQQY